VERREIYAEAIHNLAKREKEEAKVLRKKNQSRLGNILNQMTRVDHRTTWEQAQQMLLDNPAFADDDELLAMDKEDALVVFEDHIRELEKEEEIEKEKEKKRTARLQRKNRDAMNTVLDELHEQGKVTSMSLWVELYPVISQDPRFHALLGQPGSTPLDLFKFYVEELKARFHDEKKLIKVILKEKEFQLNGATSFEEFATVVCEDRRSSCLDAGNVKLTYNALLEKAENKDKERIKLEAKKLRKLEGELRSVFTDLNLEDNSDWSDVKNVIMNKEIFQTVSEHQVEKMFRDYQKYLGESCLHNHGKRKSKKNKKKRKASSSDSETDREAYVSKKNKIKRESESSESESDLDYRKNKKRRKTKVRTKYSSQSRSPISSDLEDAHKKKNRTKKVTSSLSSPPTRRVVSPMSSLSPPLGRKKGRDSLSPNKRQKYASEESVEEGELSEDELERKRIQLLQQLQEDD